MSPLEHNALFCSDKINSPSPRSLCCKYPCLLKSLVDSSDSVYPCKSLLGSYLFTNSAVFFNIVQNAFDPPRAPSF